MAQHGSLNICSRRHICLGFLKAIVLPRVMSRHHAPHLICNTDRCQVLQDRAIDSSGRLYHHGRPDYYDTLHQSSHDKCACGCSRVGVFSASSPYRLTIFRVTCGCVSRFDGAATAVLVEINKQLRSCFAYLLPHSPFVPWFAQHQ